MRSILWVLLLCTVAAVWRARSLAGALLLPYLAWVTFAHRLVLRHLEIESSGIARINSIFFRRTDARFARPN